MPGMQEFGHAPGLGDAATGGEGGIAIEDFADAANAVIGQVVHERLEIGESLLRVFVNAQVGPNEGANEPTPNCALMIGTVALGTVAAVHSDVFGVIRGEGAQAVGGQQMAGAGVQGGTLLFGRERAVGKGDSQELVGA